MAQILEYLNLITENDEFLLTEASENLINEGSVVEIGYDGTYQPIVICTISTVTPLRFASRDYYDSSDNFYKCGLNTLPDIIDRLPDIYHGVDDSQSIKLEFVNEENTIDDTWYDIIDGEEIRGVWVTIGVVDLDGTETLYIGKILSYSLTNIVSLEIDMRQDVILDTLLPKRMVNPDDFDATALDVGQPINICFGNCRDVPLRNVKNDTSGNVYDYIICEGGTDGIEGIWSTSGLGVKRNDRLVSSAEYTFYDGSQGSPYAGIAFLRFTVEQKDYSGSHYELTADIRGMKLNNALSIRERSFALCVKNLLSNSTWGLGDNVDTTSFATADTALSSDFWRCEGAIIKQRKARDIFNAMLAPAQGSYIFRGTDGEWEMAVPSTGSSVVTFGESDGYYNNCEIVNIGAKHSNRCPSQVTINYSESNIADLPTKSLSYSTGQTFGVVKDYDFEFVESTTTAKKVCSYLTKRAIYDKTIQIRAGIEARRLKRGEIFTAISPNKKPLTAGKEYIVDQINRIIGDTGYIVNGIEYNSDLYSDVTITDPTDQTLPSGTVSGPTSLVGSLTLGDGDTQPGTVTLNAPTGEQVFINAGKTDFGTSETGFILGIDDDGLAKLYVGDSAKYITFNGSTIQLKAANFEVDASGNLIATNATLSGAITATSGELQTLTVTGNITVSTGSIICGSTTLNSSGITANQGTVGGWTLSSGKLSITGIDIDSANSKIKLYSGSNYVELSPNGFVGYDSILGTTFKILTDGSAPEFSSGIIKECEYQVYTSGVIKTNSDPSTNGGLIINNTDIKGYNSVGTKLFEVIYDGTNEGDFYVGDFDSGNEGISYDHSGGKIQYRGQMSDLTDWENKTGNFTAESNKRYRIDTTSATFTMTLPLSPNVNDHIYWLDWKTKFSTNKFIINRNGQKIMGYTENMECLNDNESGFLIYTGTDIGWALF